MLFLGLIRSIEVWYILKLQPLSFKLIKPIFASIIVLILMISVKSLIMPFHTIISLLIASILIGITYIILLWLLGFDNDDKQVISALKIMVIKNK